MVNTFIVHADFGINAKILDDKRLGKQRAEAKQILLKIEDVYWLRDQLRIYQLQGEDLKGYIDRLFDAYKMTSGGQEWYRSVFDGINYNQRPIRKQYMTNPATLMWYGYTDALKYYINCCIKEFIDRGGNNTMQYYQLPPTIQWPWWLGEFVFNMFRLSLVAKYPEWYIQKFTAYGLPYQAHAALLTEGNTVNGHYLPKGYVPME